MAPKANGTDATDWARAPPSRGFCERFLRAIYDPEDSSFLGRTPKRWGICLVYYAVFYAVLAALFAICMGVLFLTLDDKRPYFTSESSLIGIPGVAYRPLPLDGFVIELDRSNSSASDQYIQHMTEFFKQYKQDFRVVNKTECVEEDSFGFPDTPCFFIKLNKVFDWEPQVYDVGSLPEDMPADLVAYIQSLEPIEQNQIWISCEQEKGANLTNLVYPWTRGLPTTFYPYRNDKGYLSPIIAVKVTEVPVNQEVAIRCRVWAKNIIYDKSLREPKGYTRIQLKVNDEGKSS